MAFDDPIVWILIVAVVVFLFGSSKIPGIAKALGQARREFEKAAKGGGESSSLATTDPNATKMQNPASVDPAIDPLVVAAQREGIETKGKSKEEIASELSWKLKNH
jgi:sec-independent protein translocase protein TatA